MSKFFNNLRQTCNNEDDFKHNTEKLMPAL